MDNHCKTTFFKQHALFYIHQCEINERKIIQSTILVDTTIDICLTNPIKVLTLYNRHFHVVLFIMA